MAHTCHALGCSVDVPEHIFACKQHWYMVPKPLRDAIWRTYRRGQEVTKNPSKAYVAAATAAIAAVALKEQEGKAREEWLPFLDSRPEVARPTPTPLPWLDTASEAALRARWPHRPPDEPCTCRPGTARWAKHHGAPGGTLPEAFHDAMEHFAEEDV